MRFCPACGCELTDHTPINIVKEWKNKARLYDEIHWSETLEKSVKWDSFTYDGRLVMYDKNEVDKYKEKAKMWDSMDEEYGMTRAQIIEYREKAKKWDEHKKEHQDGVVHGTVVSVDGYVKEWKEKAQKWDEWCNTKPGTDVNEWRDKAKKWNEHKCPPSLEFINELAEKARKWDALSKFLDKWSTI